MSKIAFPSGWPHSYGTYGCKTHLGWAVLRELRWEEVKQGGKKSWSLDCIGDHLVFIGFPSRCCVSRHLPPGQCRWEPDVASGHLPASLLATGGLWLWRLPAAVPGGAGAHHWGFFPAVGLLPTHIMRSHFSNAFVRPQWCPHPPDKAAFVSWCQNNHLPKMMARLRNSLALSLGNRKKKREGERVLNV